MERDTIALDYISLSIHILSIAQNHSKRPYDNISCLCREIEQITDKHVRLLLYTDSEKMTDLLSPRSSQIILIPVQFREVVYGSLEVETQSLSFSDIALQRYVLSLLSNICAWILHSIELSMIVNKESHSQPALSSSLTRRQQEVLKLICRGYTPKMIADTLAIAPSTVEKHRQQIYAKLDVHNEYDVMHAAYSAGLFSPIQDLMTFNERACSRA
ncbi:response regulator transcription factor [Tengunoibacter tsumagoiensis]|uniref:HTH luxR-type domain-containing protein n=1 Tax=Tengunoibacter tsumagoiensis TaxID=2014871 RepID=A0A402A946_9CHLR|nr:LuxR C-terminal-related transcriptional regulator [Tengunoibacter tsumagoiensis]GCE15697.1 hypothetical protein KTT_55560 [Tengunoibacter tsumagoiensis]